MEVRWFGFVGSDLDKLCYNGVIVNWTGLIMSELLCLAARKSLGVTAMVILVLKRSG